MYSPTAFHFLKMLISETHRFSIKPVLFSFTNKKTAL